MVKNNPKLYYETNFFKITKYWSGGEIYSKDFDYYL